MSETKQQYVNFPISEEAHKTVQLMAKGEGRFMKRMLQDIVEKAAKAYERKVSK